MGEGVCVRLRDNSGRPAGSRLDSESCPGDANGDEVCVRFAVRVHLPTPADTDRALAMLASRARRRPRPTLRRWLPLTWACVVSVWSGARAKAGLWLGYWLRSIPAQMRCAWLNHASRRAARGVRGNARAAMRRVFEAGLTR